MVSRLLTDGCCCAVVVVVGLSAGSRPFEPGAAVLLPGVGVSALIAAWRISEVK